MLRSPRTCAALAVLSLLPWIILPAFDARAGTAVRLDLDGLVGSAAACLEARVLTTRVELDALGRPCSVATLLVERDLIGAQRGTVDVRLPGGVLPNGSGLVLPGMPSLAPGEEVLLFLSERSDAGLQIPVGLAQGKFRVVRGSDGSRVLVRENAELALLDLTTATTSRVDLGVVYDYAAAIAQIQAAAARRRAVPAHEARSAEGK